MIQNATEKKENICGRFQLVLEFLLGHSKINEVLQIFEIKTGYYLRMWLNVPKHILSGVSKFVIQLECPN